MSYQEPKQITITCHLGEKDWVAHCLEMDLVTTGEFFPNAMYRMIHLIDKHLEYGRKHDSNPLQDAPKKYWPTPSENNEAAR